MDDRGITWRLAVIQLLRSNRDRWAKALAPDSMHPLTFLFDGEGDFTGDIEAAAGRAVDHQVEVFSAELRGAGLNVDKELEARRADVDRYAATWLRSPQRGLIEEFERCHGWDMTHERRTTQDFCKGARPHGRVEAER
jgi:hypothetical protein